MSDTRMQGIFARFKAAHAELSFRPPAYAVLTNPFYFVRRGLFEAVQRNAHHMHGRMLDFGCGSKPYRRLFEVAEYIGLDIAKSGHDHAGEDVDVFYDGSRIPFPDRHFDSVFTSEVLEHVFNLDEVLDELFRVMKPGAKLLLSAPFVWDEHEVPYDFARYTSFAFAHVLQRTGFSVVSIEKSGAYVETIVQMWNAYVFQHILPDNRVLRQLMTPVCIAPVTCAGLMLGRLLPRNASLYLTSIVVAQKPA